MLKRWLGVFAALTMVGTAMACSSSDDAGTPAPTDSGKDAVTDTGKPIDAGKDVPVLVDTPAPDTGPVDHGKVVGKKCVTVDDCDTTGEGWAFCTSNFYAVGAYDPTSVCIGATTDGTTDACDVGDGKTIPLCDGGVGYCYKSTATGAGPSRCIGLCKYGKDGAVTAKCEGSNACHGNNISTEGELFGYCSGGCSADSECPAKSKCEPNYGICTKTCTTDSDCPKLSGATNWGCDTTRGQCVFKYTKKVGDACTTDTECLCFKGKTDTNGQCISFCRTGTSTCGTGFVCDPTYSSKDTTGAPMFAGWTSMPAGLSGYCLKTCTADTDCTAFGQVCDASGGMGTTKTCRPKP